MRRLKAWNEERKAQARWTIPHDYLKGYRRLLPRVADIEEGKCWACRHAVAYVSWWCDRAEQGCKFEPCYTIETTTKRDRCSDRWIVGVPPLPREKSDGVKDQKEVDGDNR